MQLDNQSQAEDEEDDIDLHLAKYNKKAAKILQGKRQTRDSDEVMESDKKRPKVDEDKERIQINIRNSAAFKRMNSKKKKKQKKYESSDGGSDSDGDDDSNSDPDPEDLEEGELESD